MNDTRAEMEAFLRWMNEYHRTIDYRGLPALLLEGGRWFQGRADVNKYENARQWKKRNRPKTNDCYFNAQSFCLKHDEARYFEGYALFIAGLQPDEHSWVVMPDGKVIDFAFDAVERVATRKGVTCDASDTLYVGLEVPTAYIRETVALTEWFDALAEEYFAIQRQS